MEECYDLTQQPSTPVRAITREMKELERLKTMLRDNPFKIRRLSMALVTDFYPSLEDLFNHPHNGKRASYIAAFLSNCNTFPIFITQVGVNGKGDYIAYGVGYKWGYDAADRMSYTIYDDSQLKRETSGWFPTFSDLAFHLWRPAGRRIATPLGLDEKFKEFPFKVYEVRYTLRDEYESLSAYVAAISEEHALSLIRSDFETHEVYINGEITLRSGVFYIEE